MRRFLVSILILACLLTSLVPTLAAEGKPQRAGRQITITDCDTKEGWSSSGQLYRDWIDKTEGDASIAARAKIEALSRSSFYMAYSFPELDLTGMDLLEFDIYFSDVTLLESSFTFSAVLSSTNGTKDGTLTWTHSLYQQTYENGWNHVVLPILEATSNNFNATNARYFRLDFSRITPEHELTSYVQLDNITVSSYDTIYEIFDMCEAADGWVGTPGYLDYTDRTQGMSSVAFTVELGDNTTPPNNQAVAYRHFDAIDISWADYIEMDVYVSSRAVMGSEHSAYGIQLELTSSGKCDRNELCWTLDDYIWQEGWNHLRMPIAAARVNGGDADLAAINYIRFHIIKMQPLVRDWTIKFDNIFFSASVKPEPEKPDDPDLPVTPEIPVDPETPVNPETPVDPETPTVPEIPSEPEKPNQPSWPNVPIVPVEPETPAEDTTSRQATYTKAKALGVAMVFAVVGTDVVVMSLRKRSAASTKDTGEDEQ